MIPELDLRQIKILAGLPSPELERLGAVVKERRVPKGSFVFYADDPGPSLMFIREGEVKITVVSDEGKEAVLAYLTKGDFFGEMAVLTGQDRSANVVATADCLLYVLYTDEFEQHLRSSSGLALAMLKELAIRLRGASTKIATLALYDVTERVLRTLRSLAVEREVNGAKTLVVEKRPTHQELASLVGTSREMVTRALGGLEEDGYLRTEGKTIELLTKRFV